MTPGAPAGDGALGALRPGRAAPGATELAQALLGLTTTAVDALVRTHVPGWRVPRTFGGHRVGADVRADLVFTLGLLHGAGVHQVAETPVVDALTAVLAEVDGSATDTFFSYRIAETLLRWGPFEGNPLLAHLDDAARAQVALACDSTSHLPLLDGLLPRNYAAVLARCELARAQLGLPTDVTVLDDLLARTDRLLSGNPGGFLDDSEDGTGARYDIYTVDVYLFCAPLARHLPDRLGHRWRHGLASAVGLVEQVQAGNGAALAWGRSIGVLALCHAIELAVEALDHGLGDDPARWLARAQLAASSLEGWFAPDGVITAHQHRSPYGYRGPHRRLQMTLDCLGKLAWAAGRLAELASSLGDVRAVPVSQVLGPRDALVAFGEGAEARGPAGVWAYRSHGTALALPLVGATRSDYLPAPEAPGLWEVPVDRDLAVWVPAAWSEGVAYCGGGVPTEVEHGPGRLRARWDGLAEVARPGWQGRVLAGERTTTHAVEGRTLCIDEHLRFDVVPDALSLTIPEAEGRPLRVEVECDAPHATTTIDTSGVKEWRSFWGELPRVHQLDVDPAAEVRWSVRVTPMLRVATEAGHHHYHRSLYGPLADRVVETSFGAHLLGRPDAARARLRHVDLHHLHWPEWFTGDDLPAARRFCEVLTEADVRLVWTQHNLVPHLDGEWSELYALIAGRADGVVHHSAWGMERALARWPYREGCVHRVIPHGHWGNLAPDHDDPAWRAARRAEAEAELDLAPCRLRLGIVGAPRRDKDVVGFAEAFAASGRDDLGLLVLSLAEGEAVPDDPRITGRPYEFVDRATYDRRLAAIDVLVLPFAPDGQMLTTGVAADAIAGGVPALVTSWPYLVESLGEAGLPLGDDAAAWTAAVDALDPAAVVGAADAARALRARHDWAVVAEQHLELLDAVGSAKH